MALFARLDKQIAEELLFEWPSHRWVQKSVKFLLSQGPNADHIKNIPLNDKLLESVKKNGFEKILGMLFIGFGLWAPDLVTFDLTIGFLVKNYVYTVDSWERLESPKLINM